MEFPIFQSVPPVLPLANSEKSLAPSSPHPPSAIYRRCSDPPAPSLPEDEQPHLSAPPLTTASCLLLCFSPCQMPEMGMSAPLGSHGVQGLLWPRSPPVLRRGSGSHRCTELAGGAPGRALCFSLAALSGTLCFQLSIAGSPAVLLSLTSRLIPCFRGEGCKLGLSVPGGDPLSTAPEARLLQPFLGKQKPPSKETLAHSLHKFTPGKTCMPTHSFESHQAAGAGLLRITPAHISHKAKAGSGEINPLNNSPRVTGV